MKRAVLTVLLASATLAVAAPALAGTQDGAVVALHVTAHATKQTLVCAGGNDPITTATACASFVVNEASLNAARDIYLVVANADAVNGIAGVSCGISFDAAAASGVDMFGWTLCSDLDFPNGGWPESGGGDRITWAAATNCQRTELGADGVHAVAGAFYVYAYTSDNFSVTTNNGVPVPELQVADCASAATDLAEGGTISFGLNEGCNPCTEECIVIPVESTTWGKIKTLGGE